MTATASQRLDRGPVDPAFWPAVAQAAVAWLAQRDVSARDTVVLLPHAALLAPARTAFARRGGWQPRVETVHTLAASLGPPPATHEASLVGDPATDRLSAALLLRRHAGAWVASLGTDARTFDDAVIAVADTARALHRAAHERAPSQREAWWAALRDALPPLSGPGQTERLLARVALEWAAASAPAATDALWSMHAAAWMGVFAAGEARLAAALLDHHAATSPVLRLDVDAPHDKPFDAAARLPSPAFVQAGSLEDEALAATLAVFDAIERNQTPVALIAQDRLVVRRIRALLERGGVAIDDETGWTLSTTRAGAHAMAWLRAAAQNAGRDALIEALKIEAPRAAEAIEEAWRREREPPREALDVGNAWRQRADALRARGTPALSEWLRDWAAAAPRLIEALTADTAGRQLLAALNLDGAAGSAAWRSAADATRCDFAGFTAWVDTALEAATFVPPAAAEAQVIITPLARAVLRPFGAVVCPGGDERHLGARDASVSLLPEAVAQTFGIADARSRQQREGLAFAQLLRAPNLTLIRRSHDGEEPVAASALIERAWLARRRAGTSIPEERVFEPPTATIARRPVARPAPVMADALPTRLSPSAIDALRDCPYRFFARSALGLSEVTELDAEIDKSDHGRWLHALLHRFHRERSGTDDKAELLAAADAEQALLALDAAALLPYRAAFDTFADHYLAWLHDRDAQGWRYAGGELARRCTPPELGGIALEGRLDRIDLGPDGGAMVIDYKSGRPDKLARRVKEPLEDTQLAVYAALLTEEPHEPLPRAIYLTLPEREAPKAIEHADVAHSAALLIEGLAQDLDALRSGAGAAALGEGEACTYCAARGLCRRDHWAEGK